MAGLIQRVLDMKREWDTDFFMSPPKAVLAGPIEYVGLRAEILALCDESNYIGFIGIHERPSFRGDFKIIGIPVKPKMTPGLDFEVSEPQCMELVNRTVRDSLRVV